MRKAKRTDRSAGRPLLRLVRAEVSDEVSDEVPDEVELPRYLGDPADELRRTLRVLSQRNLGTSGEAERARRNAEVVVIDLLSALNRYSNGDDRRCELTNRIDRVASAVANRDACTLATISLVQAIVRESKHFDAPGIRPRDRFQHGNGLREFLWNWSEYCEHLDKDLYFEAAVAWAEAKRGRNTAVWRRVANAIKSARLGTHAPESLRRRFRGWEASGLITR